MNVTFPELRVGDPQRHQALSVFPLFAEPNGDVEYRVFEEALADQSVLVEETSEAGSVPELLVRNKGDVRVLFLEGEELIGAKQNRILNTSVLIAAHTHTKIPVSCVEQGRWRYKSRFFGSSGGYSPSKLRRAMRASVSHAVKAQRGHTSDQVEVWKEVANLHATHGVVSGTAAMSDAFETHQERVTDYRDRFKYVADAIGVAIAVGEKVVAVDVFDKPATCHKVWDRLLSGVVFDAMEAGDADQHASVADVEQLLSAASELPWKQTEAVGEGEEYRAETQHGQHATALVFGATVVHAAI